MSAQNHPHYNEEHQQLDTTIGFIRDAIDQGTPVIGYGATSFSSSALWKIKTDQIEALKEALKQPYFGRVDWRRTDEQAAETFYVGKHSMPTKNIFSWKETLAGDLYYLMETQREHGTLLLKRALTIENAQITAISDEYIDASLGQNVIANRFTDSALVALLQQHRSGQLHDIVATIQAQQYRIIRAPYDQVLIVQGVPGSGKTSIALHRVAYLLYQQTLNVRAKNVLVLGPNRMFMQYIAGILPDLGEQEVPQYTFDEWAVATLGLENLDYEPQEQVLEALLDSSLSSIQHARLYRMAYIKGSFKMAYLLDRYVDLLAGEVLVDKEPLTCTYETTIRIDQNNGFRSIPIKVQVTRSLSDLARVLDRDRLIPFNRRRDKMEQRLVNSIVTEIERQVVEQLTQRNLRPSEINERERTTEISEAVRRQIRHYFNDWPALNTAVAYRRLLRTPSLLERAGRELFNRWDLEVLHQDAPKAGRRFHFADLAALLYLQIRLDGVQRVYDHIVVDEAQDLTPLLFMTLLRACRDQSMTVLGDIDQSIYAHHGINSWTDLEGAIIGMEPTVETIRQSYRSTRQIIEFANGVLRRSGVTPDRLAEPINRTGTSPMLHQCSSQVELRDEIICRMKDMLAAGRRSIAIVCKTVTGCRELADALRLAWPSDGIQQIEDRNTIYNGGIALIPVYLTKGLEFDAVIIADADGTTYPGDDVHARLLYVAITRAAHMLHICWIGQRTPLLGNMPLVTPLPSPLIQSLQPKPVTISAYAKSHPGHTADWCVERLAATEKLHLLRDGRIDEVVLDMLLADSVRATVRDDDGLNVTALTEAQCQQLRSQVLTADTAAAPAGLTLLQLSYGLFNNHLRATGIHTAEGDERTVDGQAIELVTLLHALRTSASTLSGGRWTTHQRTLGLVDPKRRDLASTQLALLVQEGIVEEQISGQRTQIRVQPDWLVSLLELILGNRPRVWEPEIIAQLEPLAQPLTAVGGAA